MKTSPTLLGALLLAMAAPHALAQHERHEHHHHPAQHEHSEHHHHATPQADDDCAPEHAAMGHCTPAPATPPVVTQPHTPIPVLTDTDRAAAFPVLRQQHHHASTHYWRMRVNQLEGSDSKNHHGSQQSWDVDASWGGDIHRLLLQSEGERSGGATASAHVRALYSRSITPWWDAVMGLQRDFEPHARTWATVGIQGLAPHFFELSALLRASNHGQMQLELEAEYEVLLTNRLILQPTLGLTASGKTESTKGIVSGFNQAEAGLRLRYEITRQFAPYIGIVHERSFGRTAQWAAHPRETRWVAGVRLWF